MSIQTFTLSNEFVCLSTSWILTHMGTGSGDAGLVLLTSKGRFVICCLQQPGEIYFSTHLFYNLKRQLTLYMEDLKQVK